MEDVITRKKTKIEVPKTYNVILINDDFTPIWTVMNILVSTFGKTEDEAAVLANQVHVQGKGIAGTYPYDIAETKASLAELMARSEGHPLKLDVQPA